MPNLGQQPYAILHPTEWKHWWEIAVYSANGHRVIGPLFAFGERRALRLARRQLLRYMGNTGWHHATIITPEEVEKIDER